MNKKEILLEWSNDLNKKGIIPGMVIAHYIDKGHTLWKNLDQANLEKQIMNLFVQEQKDKEQGMTWFIPANVAAELSRAAFELAKMDDKIRIAIIKKFIV